jgi:hypothetical protein
MQSPLSFVLLEIELLQLQARVPQLMSGGWRFRFWSSHRRPSEHQQQNQSHYHALCGSHDSILSLCKMCE